MSGQRKQAFERLRTRMPAPVKTAVAGLRSIGMPALDAVLGGGLPPGSLLTIEGPLGSGGSGLLARLLAATTQHDAAALVEQPQTVSGRFDPAALAAAGVRLERLFLIHAEDATQIARACDVLIRSGIFSLLALPMPQMRAQVWTRLAQLAHRHACTLIAIGDQASSELRFCATVRLQCMQANVQWSGASGIFSYIDGAHIDITVAKNKLAAPGGSLRLYYRRERQAVSTAELRCIAPDLVKGHWPALSLTGRP